MSIRRKPLHRMKQEREEQDEILESWMKDYKEPDTWTIILAMNRVLELAENSSLSEMFWKASESPLAFLRQELGLTDIQIVVLAIMIEAGATRIGASSGVAIVKRAIEIEQGL